ncbi:CAP domain-containing protein [Sporomusa ovata]|nr:CAP domain-containing protein [Sporomusa ovata]
MVLNWLKSGNNIVIEPYFNHTNLQGQSPFDRLKANGITYRSAGENIGYNYSVKKLEEAWMNSPGHRANILNTSYTHVGLGLYPGENGSLYGVQVFAGY